MPGPKANDLIRNTLTLRAISGHLAGKASVAYFVKPSRSQYITGRKKNANGNQVNGWLIRKQRVGFDSSASCISNQKAKHDAKVPFNRRNRFPKHGLGMAI